MGLLRFDRGWFELRGHELPGLVVLDSWPGTGPEGHGDMTYECINPRCKGREIKFDHVKNRWFHVDTGFRLCDPTNDNLQAALPKPPDERVKALPDWVRPHWFRQSGP